MKIVFISAEHERDMLLGREAREYLFREFDGWDFSVAEEGGEEECFKEDAVNAVIPLDMPLVTVGDIASTLDSMRRKKISFMRLGGRDSSARIVLPGGECGGFFVTGTSFLKLGGAKSSFMVYNSLKERIIDRHLGLGVRIADKHSTFIDDTAVIGAGAEIRPFCRIEGACRISSGAKVAASYLRDCTAEEDAVIEYSYLTDSRVRARAQVGPFARLRGADIGEGCRIGDFVEVKASALADGVKCAHLSYIGDAEVGANTNVGCGTVFCNYDGSRKHKTKVGGGCFIGANTNLVAPLTVGDSCFIAAGTTVSNDMEDGTFAIGRVRQETKKR